MSVSPKSVECVQKPPGFSDLSRAARQAAVWPSIFDVERRPGSTSPATFARIVLPSAVLPRKPRSKNPRFCDSADGPSPGAGRTKRCKAQRVGGSRSRRQPGNFAGQVAIIGAGRHANPDEGLTVKRVRTDGRDDGAGFRAHRIAPSCFVEAKLIHKIAAKGFPAKLVAPKTFKAVRFFNHWLSRLLL